MSPSSKPDCLQDRKMHSFLTPAISARASQFGHCETTKCVTGTYLVTSRSSKRRHNLWHNIVASLGCAHRYLCVLSESDRAHFLSGITAI